MPVACPHALVRCATFSAFDTHSGRSAGIRFARLASGTRIAWAASGRGPPLVRVAHWMTHVEQDLQSPLWGPWRSRLNQSVQLVRYDERGCGLSGADSAELGLQAALEELEVVVEAVFDATGQRQVALLGMSGAAAPAIAYAAKHPERVSRLVLHGAYACGLLHRSPTAEQLQMFEATVKLMELGWGRADAAVQQFMTTSFIPKGGPWPWCARGNSGLADSAAIRISSRP